jgi:hypothetical protein
MTFVIRHDVKPRISYKELSLLAGILVALIILLVMWLHPGETDSPEIGRQFHMNGMLPLVKVI